MENPNWSIGEMEPNDEESAQDFINGSKLRNKNAKQLTWVLLLIARHAAGFFSSIASAVSRRVKAGKTDSADARNNRVKNRILFALIKSMFVIAILLFCFEVFALWNGTKWELENLENMMRTTTFGVNRLFDWVYERWVRVRIEYLAPPLQFLTNGCVVLFLIQSLDKLVLCLGFFWIKIKKIRPVAAESGSDLEDGYFPMVLVQIPMCNEREDNDEVGLVQARWSFVNKDENLLTRLQYINMSFHFEVEQQVNGIFIDFFSFNGTAGVWRIKALEESGGWLERTTVEDMDIAVRAHLNGWKFVYLNDVECQCELPESYEAYRKQQHRWHSGPMQLFRLCWPDIIRSKISIWKKFNMIFLFFFLRKLILPFYSFTFFCIILPMTMFIPEAELPAWVVCYIPAATSLLNILPAPKSFPIIVPYLLFENTMSVTKFNAMISGLFQLRSAYEWVVTKKSGRSSKGDLVALVEKEMKPQRANSEPNLAEAKEELQIQAKKASAKKKKKKHNRICMKELSLAFLLLTAATRSLFSSQSIHSYFLLFQGISFLLVGLDLIGEQVD